MIKDIQKPLAERMRPKTLADFLGQNKIIGDGRMLRQSIESGSIPSIILWGPPGTGKTTLALIIASEMNYEFIQFSAVVSGVKDLREVIKKAKENKMFDKRTILFIDEIHRWNKAQQDALLPHIEDGTITLIGATTENPSFEVRSALLSRCRVFVLESLSSDSIKQIIKRTLSDNEIGLGSLGVEMDDEVLEIMAKMSNGDARTALNVLEYASSINRKIDLGVIKESFQKSHLRYDKNGDEHYNIISALHKSMRGSDENAALYWLARMIEAGEDALYIARRLVRFASEDIGLANSRALEQAVAAYQACHFIGLPESNVILAQVVVYMAKCKKSNSLYVAYRKVREDIRETGNLPVPVHLRNAPTTFMKDLDYAKDYKYSPDHGYGEEQNYFPEEMKGKKYIK